MIPVGKKIELFSKVNSIQVSHQFHQPKSGLNHSIDLEFNITRPVRGIKLQLSYYLTDENGVTQTVLIKRSVDLCFYIQNPNSDRFVKNVFDYLRERTNVQMKCPIAPGNYYMRNIRPADFPVPGFLPESYFVMETIYRSEVRRATLIEFRYFGKMLYPIITHYDFRGNDKYINSSLDIYGTDPLNKTYAMEFFVFRTIRDAKIVLTLSVRAFDGVGRTALFTRVVDGCEFIRRPSSDRLIKAFYDEIKKSSKIPRCPYNPGDSISIIFTPHALSMPSIVPETDCFFDVKTYTRARTELIFETQLHCSMRRRANVKKVLGSGNTVRAWLAAAFLPTFNDSLLCTPFMVQHMYPIITYHDVKGNNKYVNAWIEVLGNDVMNKTYVLQFEVIRVIRDCKMALTFSVPALTKMGTNALVTRTIDGCEFLRRPSSDRLVKMVYDQIKQDSKIPQCPYRPGTSIGMNFTPYSMTMPRLLPETECAFEIKAYTNAQTEKIFETVWKAILKKRENLRKGMSLIAIISYKEVKANERYLNASIEDVGDHEWNRTYLFHFKALHDIRSLKNKFSYSIRAFDGAVQNALVSRTLDVCEMYRNPPSNRLVRMYCDPLVKSSKIRPCPFKPGDTIMLNITPSIYPVPSFVPETEFLIDVKGFTKVVPVVTYRELLSNTKYVNATLVEVINNEWSTTYLVYFDIFSESIFTYSIRAFKGAINTKIYSRWVDACEMVRRPPTDRLIRKYYDIIANHSKLIYCPYKPGYRAMLNITPSAWYIPSFVPETDFFLETKSYVKERTVLALQSRWYGSVVRFEVDPKKLIAIVTHKEVKANGRYLKTWIEDVGGHEWNRTHLFHFEALRDIKDLKNYFSYSIRAFDGAVQNALVSRTIDGCEVYKNPPTNRFLKMYYDPLVKYSQIRLCPYKAGDTMMLNITPSVYPIPNFVPETEFVVLVKGFISVGKIRLFETRWYGKLKRMFNV
uniref:Uncharacterized protein n=1 Tax=Anopheles epiroticus TaxID=199890 RepID=A0A182PVI3_9DIPT